ncbi:MAG: PorP/SprF family type IX secretion system membrane protein [Bacteroidales bacterium]|nr:PorP/SprF family type IX secretion system membrane protein [Bacteroidales bacterium]
MMKNVRKIFAVAALLCLSLSTMKAQDVVFSQFYANPLYLNPAFAGSKVCPRVSLNFRNQWPALVSAFTTVSASYDQYVDALHGGVGGFILTDRQGDHGALSTSMASVMYAFRFQAGKEVFVNAALQAGVVNTSLNWDELRFPDMIDRIYGFTGISSAQMPQHTNVWYLDFAAGALVYGPAWYAGVSAAHLTQPSNGFYGVTKLPMKLTANVGALINISEEKRRTSSLGLGTPVISPNLVYQYQGGFHYFNYGVYLDWMPFMVGVWFRNGIENADAFIFMVGVQQDYFKVGYSYDVTVSHLANNTSGAHELSVGILLPCPEQKHKVKAIRCPSF